MSSQSISPICIYTIVHTNKLNVAYKQGGKSTFTENKRWVTAKRLLQDCKLNGLKMLVIFAPAKETSHLISYGTLDEVKIDNEALTTDFQVSDLKLFGKRRPPKTSVIVKSTGKPIPEGHIRPYVICETPKQLLRRKRS